MIHLNIGSNLEFSSRTKHDNIAFSINLLINSQIKIKKISNFYETPSYPNQNLPKFLNIGLLISYEKDYLDLFKNIKYIEKKLGRIKTKKNDPRVIDIDIIDFYGKNIKHDKVILPHPRSHLRNFVLYPIKEIDPVWVHPILKKNVDFLINQLSQKSRIEITRLNKSVII